MTNTIKSVTEQGIEALQQQRLAAQLEFAKILLRGGKSNTAPERFVSAAQSQIKKYWEIKK